MHEAFGCPTSDSSSNAWKTKDEEYIKFGHRLMYQRKGNLRDLILERYKSAWRKSYPDTEVPLTTDGEPFDFLSHPEPPVPNIPWMKDIPDLNGTIFYNFCI